MTNIKVKKIQINGRDLHIREDEPLDWFEDLYSASDPAGEGVPWANMETHPLFAAWLERRHLDGKGKSAIVVGCGMGDDAIELELLGFDVTAFDFSNAAIEYCKKRFPDSKVNFVQADLFSPPDEWAGTFDFVLEIYTVQAVPPAYEGTAIRNISGFIAPRGQALVITEVGAGERSFDKGPPWPLTPEHVEAFASHDLNIEDRHVGETDENGMTTFITTFARSA